MVTLSRLNFLISEKYLTSIASSVFWQSGTIPSSGYSISWKVAVNLRLVNSEAGFLPQPKYQEEESWLRSGEIVGLFISSGVDHTPLLSAKNGVWST